MRSDHFNYLFLVLAPILGIVVHFFLPKKVTYYVLGGAVICLMPLLFNYQCTVPYYYEIFALLGASCLCGLSIKTIVGNNWLKIVVPVCVSFLLFFVIMSIAFFTSFGSDEGVIKKWESQTYRIEEVESYGFSGPHFYYYRLNKYAVIPIFFSLVDKGNYPGQNECDVTFLKAQMRFNTCEEKLTQAHSNK